MIPYRRTGLLVACAVGLLLAGGPALSSAAPEADGWRWDNVPRVVAVGDVHGAYDNLELILRATRLIDDEGSWIGGEAHFVSLGDVVDRGPDGRDRCCKVRVVSNTCEGHNPERFAVEVRIKDPCRVNAVTWDGSELPAGDGPHAWRSWQDPCSTFVLASLAAPFGGPERELVVRYDCPYFGS